MTVRWTVRADPARAAARESSYLRRQQKRHPIGCLFCWHFMQNFEPTTVCFGRRMAAVICNMSDRCLWQKQGAKCWCRGRKNGGAHLRPIIFAGTANVWVVGSRGIYLIQLHASEASHVPTYYRISHTLSRA